MRGRELGDHDKLERLEVCTENLVKRLQLDHDEVKLIKLSSISFGSYRHCCQQCIFAPAVPGSLKLCTQTCVADHGRLVFHPCNYASSQGHKSVMPD